MSVNTEDVQVALNHFRRKRLRGVQPLIVDGEKGPATSAAIAHAKWYLGFRSPNSDEAGTSFIKRLEHPRRARLFPSPQTKIVARGIKRRIAQRAHFRAQVVYSYVSPGVVRWTNGVPVAKVAVKYLEFAQKHDWKGTLNSGWRSKAYSQSLCYARCGQPTCAGTCAGIYTNHVGTTENQFALDVSDYTKFAEIMNRPDAPNPRIFNALGAQDPVHFSPSGR